MDIVLCSDRNIIVGMHVTLLSVLRSTSSYVNIHIIHDHITDSDFERIEETIASFYGKGRLFRYAFATSQFAHLRAHRGNRFSYARLMIADIVPATRIIYLDSDLLVNIDLQGLYDTNLSGHVFGASGIQAASRTMEGRFFREIGLLVEDDARCFNAGVMLIDLEAWRRSNMLQRCMDFANKWSQKLPTQDQTILNYVGYKNKYLALDDFWNVPVRASAAPPDLLAHRAVFHFLGVPKPWDLGGEWLHRSYPLFKDALSSTAMSGYRPTGDISGRRVLHSVRIARSYYQAVAKKLRQT